MTKFVSCDCGVTVRNDDLDALVAEVQEHVLQVHWTEVERDDILEMIEDDAT
jgi:predicted small metal-binding protein